MGTMSILRRRHIRTGRWRGALAGLVPTLAIALLFVVGGTTATPPEVATSLALVALIATSAGWLAGPLAAGEPRRLAVAALGYAIALLATVAALSMVQAAWDSLAGNGVDPFAIVVAVTGRGLYAVAGAAYLIIPAIVLGAAWSLSAWGLAHLVRTRSS
jgi:hypothetical protein